MFSSCFQGLCFLLSLPSVSLKIVIIGKVELLQLSGKHIRLFFFFWTFKILGFSILAIKLISTEFLANPCLGDTRQTHTDKISIDSGWSNQQAVLTVEIIDSRNSKIFCSKARMFPGIFLVLSRQEAREAVADGD